MLRHVSLAAFVLTTLTACSDDSSDKTSSVATASTGLVFTASSSTAWPWTQGLFRLNPETFEVENLLEGESNDTVVFNVGNDVLMFNRATDSLNYRLIKSDAQNKTLSITNQTQYEEASAYDPYSAMGLEDDVVLLSKYSAGALSIMQPSTGKKLSDVTADWNLPEGVPLKPSSLWRTKVAGKTLIYFMHEGSAFESGLFTVNGSQSVFVLEQNGASVTAVDLDPSTPKVDGIKVAGSFPKPIAASEQAQGDKLVIVSMCARFVNPNPTDATKVCKSIVEEIDPATQTVSTVWDLDGAGFYMNGGVVSTGSQGMFFAQVDQDVDGVSAKSIVKFDPYSKTSEKIYDYEATSSGAHGLYYDDVRGNLFIGDVNTDTIGKFTILKKDGTTTVKAIDGIPYSGTFIY